MKYFKTIIPLLFIMACNRNNDNITPTPTTTLGVLEADYIETQGNNDFRTYGNCFPGNPSWFANFRAGIWQQNGHFWIDSCNYVIKSPIPITKTSESSFTFDSYQMTSEGISIDGGTGNLLDDTLIVTIQAHYLTGCMDAFTSHGKYSRH